MQSLKMIVEQEHSTIMAEYKPSVRTDESYQSEAQLESEFIEILKKQGYEYANIKDENALRANLKIQLEKLNNVKLSEGEWDRFFKEVIANSNASIVEKTELIQGDGYIQSLKRDDGSTINFKLIDKDIIHNNTLQVINQYAVETPTRKNRYDVSVLVNGLPLVHIELKRRGISIKEAFNQINRYGRESFFAGSGLFEFVQIFVISNGTQTKYYSNTTRKAHLSEQQGRNTQKTSHSFEFTSYFSDEKNTPILELIDFARSFFAKHTLLHIICRYCVFDVDKKLLVMRPYQIAATEKIIQKIAISYANGFYGDSKLPRKIDERNKEEWEKRNICKSGGYIWHTTGSGKTLTSFKSAQLISKIKEIDKVLFVVDRKDLDYQSMKEYERFQKGAVSGSRDTKDLAKKLCDRESKIIITTLQKLARFIQSQKGQKNEVFDRHIVMIFDECHRSQFGSMHKEIVKYFKKFYLFGFTGTPILAENASGTETTEKIFGKRLHTYTIVNAIRDKNVLPFRVEYLSTMRQNENIEDKEVQGIDTEEILLSPSRIKKICQYILTNFDTHTKRNEKAYTLKDKRLRGFNALLATSSIPAAMQYYNELKKQLEAMPESSRIKIGIIFSYAPNDEAEELDSENNEDTQGLEQSQRDFLDSAISDYNASFKSNFNSSSEGFQNYYKDFAKRLKDRELDLGIVVNMFLTGFDATTMNTLFVDKNLKYHGLLQAYSRTNRILNAVKSFGNIICFRNLYEQTNKALQLFGDEGAQGIVFLRTFEEYFCGYTDENGKAHKGYRDLLGELVDRFSDIHSKILDEQEAREFASLFGEILRLKNILECFEEFREAKEQCGLSERDLQDYQSRYIDVYDEWIKKTKSEGKESVLDDVGFEIELIKQVEITLAYILELIRNSEGDKDKILEQVGRLIDSTATLRSKKDLLINFIETFNPQGELDSQFESYIKDKRAEELDRIITNEKLKSEATKSFMNDAFERGEIRPYGQNFSSILPSLGYFGKQAEQNQTKRTRVLGQLEQYLERFMGFWGSV